MLFKSPLKEYKHNHFSILLPTDSLLQIHQQNHRLYDRFLPFLAKYLPAGSTVIDVGAHCGDTMAAMFDRNQGLQFVCVEPDASRYDLLQQNVQRIRAFDGSLQVQAVRSFAGRNATRDGGMRTLDEIASTTNTERVRLLKTDTDGSDSDAIGSAEALIERDWPLIFFECEYHNLAQRTASEELLASLQARGYANWVVFDNFGEVMMQTRDIEPIRQLMGYVWRLNHGRSSRTIYYYDILAATDADREFTDRVIADYIAQV